jgi:hypothetical protein
MGVGLYSCRNLGVTSNANTFIFLQIDNDITLEDAPKSTKKLWRFLLKNLNVKRNGGKKGFPFLFIKKMFTFGLFFRYVGDGFSPWSVFVTRVSTEFKACNRKSFCWVILHMSMTDTFSFNIFKSSTML